MTEFFQFMFRDKDTALGLGLFIIVLSMVIMSGLDSIARAITSKKDED